MAHTIMKQIYDPQKKKYIQCEVLVLDEEENMPPGTDRREILLTCNEQVEPFTGLDDELAVDIEDIFPETELIDQYEDFDNRQD
ncbi:MAG: hypothetical protein GX568_06000 [Candidatus Gastranaerophilales bacterium]|nr:hypothetical protein [Candidatus Gastranaerophilales bacterium]